MKFTCKFEGLKDGIARLIFELESLKLVHTISYQFACYRDDKFLLSWSPHVFIKNIQQPTRHEWETVDILKSYFPNVEPKKGKYSIEITIRYFVCGEDKERFTKSTAEVQIG